MNIAEDSAKKSDKEFARYLETSIASLNEVVACLDIMRELKKINKEEFDYLVLEGEILVKQLGCFIKKVKC